MKHNLMFIDHQKNYQQNHVDIVNICIKLTKKLSSCLQLTFFDTIDPHVLLF